jgi:hypothetical protein
MNVEMQNIDHFEQHVYDLPDCKKFATCAVVDEKGSRGIVFYDKPEQIQEHIDALQDLLKEWQAGDK